MRVDFNPPFGRCFCNRFSPTLRYCLCRYERADCDLALEDAMLELFRGGALAAATLTTGLMAGLYYAYAISVMPGLSRTDDRTFVSAMQQINVAIINPWFFVSFFGALVFTALAAVLHLRGDGQAVLPWIAAAFGCLTWALVLHGRTL